MADPILDEIWRVREQLLKKHGGLRGLLDHIRELDRTRGRRKGTKAVKPRRKPARQT